MVFCEAICSFLVMASIQYGLYLVKLKVNPNLGMANLFSLLVES